MNELLLNFAQWLGSQPSSEGLLSSFYLWNWIESTHVLTLMIFLGMLFVIDLRMLGLSMTSIPASKVSERLDKPLMIGFTIMVITGLLLFYANAVHETQGIWFRLKLVFLVLAGINALLFRNIMKGAISSWDSDPIPPKRIRVGAGLSVLLWTIVIIMGRLMAYDWFDCTTPQGPFINWAVGCDIG